MQKLVQCGQRASCQHAGLEFVVQERQLWPGCAAAVDVGVVAEVFLVHGAAMQIEDVPVLWPGT